MYKRQVYDGAVEREGPLVRISATGGAHALIEVLRALDGHDLEPATLTVREPSMDDVFLKLTGHHAEHAADDAASVQAKGKRSRRTRGAA